MLESVCPICFFGLLQCLEEESLVVVEVWIGWNPLQNFAQKDLGVEI